MVLVNGVEVFVENACFYQIWHQVTLAILPPIFTLP